MFVVRVHRTHNHLEPRRRHPSPVASEIKNLERAGRVKGLYQSPGRSHQKRGGMVLSVRPRRSGRVHAISPAFSARQTCVRPARWLGWTPRPPAKPAPPQPGPAPGRGAGLRGAGHALPGGGQLRHRAGAGTIVGHPLQSTRDSALDQVDPRGYGYDATLREVASMRVQRSRGSDAGQASQEGR